MEHQKNSPNFPEDQDWWDDILGKAAAINPIEADPAATTSTKLTHPDDLELERILSDSWLKEFLSDPPEKEKTQAFTVPGAKFIQPKKKKAPAQEEQADQPELPTRQKPPKPTTFKGWVLYILRTVGNALLGVPHLVSFAIWAILIIAIGIGLGRTLWVCCADVMAFGKPSQVVTITITEEDDLADVSKKLADAELIRYPNLFKLFAELTGKEERISTGVFTLNSHLDYNAMINAMTPYAKARKEVEIMFPEGYNCKQIFALLEEKEVCSVADLEEYAASGELSEYWFLEGVERGDKYCLEGYLFPDTYKFYTNDEPRRVIEKFLNGFDYRFTDKMQEDFITMQGRYAKALASRGYDQDYIDKNGLTMRKLVIIASLIEKETAGGEESYNIASVIYNRLTNPAENPFLNIDAALVYALGGKKDLTEEDKLLDSPYNTYKYTGLIPGPISNPGRDSLYAALDPNDTSYLYYALNPSTGKHKFSSSYNEHLNFLNSLG